MSSDTTKTDRTANGISSEFGGLSLDGSFAKSLFLGNILEENLFPFPRMAAEEAELVTMVVESVNKFLVGKDELFREFDVTADISPSHLQEMREMGLFGLIIPEQFGGIGLSSSGYARVVQEVGKYDSATSLTMGAHSSIGMKGILLFGTEAQKTQYLPRLASGEFIAAFCLTEPGSGSDAASIKTSVKKSGDGSYILNGEKLWITNGPLASLYTVFARSEDGNLSAFIVERSYPGVSTGSKEDKMGIRGSLTTSVILDEVKVPAENLLGEEGQGFKVAMTILNSGRTGLGGGCVGGLKRCIELATAQAQDRKQFGKPIAEYGLIQEKIAQMAVDCFACESVVALIGHYIDSGCTDYSVEAAVAKVFCSDALWRGTNEALQIAGGNGYMREYPYERMVRDSRINLIFEGTNEILRVMIALSGLKEAGRYLTQIGSAASGLFNNPLHGFGLMSEYASRKLSQLTSIGGERLDVPAALRSEARVYELATLGLAREAERVIKQHGKKIVDRQFILKRLANVTIDIVVGCAMLSRISSMIKDKGESGTKVEREILRLFTLQAKQRIKAELRSVEREEDTLMESIAREMLAQGKFGWDVTQGKGLK